MRDLYMMLVPPTGDTSKPGLFAVCLIVSIVLMAVLIITGRNSGSSDDSDEDFEEDTVGPEIDDEKR